MKRLAAVLMALVLVLGLTACGGVAIQSGNATEAPSTQTEAPSTQTEAPAETPELEDVYEGKWIAKVDCSELINKNLDTVNQSAGAAMGSDMPELKLSEVSGVCYEISLTAELGNAELTMAISDDIADKLVESWEDDFKTWMEAYCKQLNVPLTEELMDTQMDSVVEGMVQGIESSMGSNKSQSLISGAYRLSGTTLLVADTPIGTLTVVDADTLELQLDSALASGFETIGVATTWTLERK